MVIKYVHDHTHEYYTLLRQIQFGLGKFCFSFFGYIIASGIHCYKSVKREPWKQTFATQLLITISQLLEYT